MSSAAKPDPGVAKRVEIGIKHFEEAMGHLPV
jgi:hypothetical protein